MLVVTVFSTSAMADVDRSKASGNCLDFITYAYCVSADGDGVYCTSNDANQTRVSTTNNILLPVT